VLIDEHACSHNRAQLALDTVEITPVVDGDTGRKIDRVELVRIVRNERNARDTLGTDAVRDGVYAEGPIDGLTAGHGDGVVVEDLVCNIGAGGDRLADRH
jgi:hypothetical protein